jgi:hypothetical protein
MNPFIKKYLITTSIYALAEVIICSIIGLIDKDYPVIYSGLLFLPFPILYVFAYDLSSRVLNPKYISKSKFKNVINFSMVALFRTTVILIPLLIAAIINNGAIFNVATAVIITAIFVPVPTIVLIFFTKKNIAPKNETTNN